MLVAQANRTPDKVFVRTAEGDLTYAEVLARTEHLAAGLAAAGVRSGEPVAVLMHNSAEAVLVWFAINRLGAVHVPINTALVGAGLAHTFRTTGASFTIADDDLAHLVPQSDTTLLRGLPTLDEPSPVAVPPELDPAIMLFTSGTTGVSKACVLSHRYVVRQGQIHAHYLGLTADDVLYCPFPLFHVDAVTLTVVAALAVGATAAIGVKFSASGFWDEVRRFDATVFNFMGATLTILWKQPARPGDRDHRVRLAWGVPMPAWQDEWERRFGFRLYEIYGLTDGGIVAYDPIDSPKRVGTCGKVIPEFDVVVDAPPGEVGEILIRGREPGLVMTGYYGMPDATAAVLRDGFLHTGDLGTLTGDGYLTFAGRAKDSIRRRGENISAYEVEQVVEGHPSVLECAAIGVPSELSEEDVKVCVVLRPGHTLTADDLVAHCAANSAPFMVPRYVEFLPELPKTPTQKVEKFRLRQAHSARAA
ncbi:crotonobetaine/carnitine-CoA ligase [Actinocrispum wychmicini]|uniref:Crotonobetaine/carnitine-CoA ligase n=2 Tax=Actinocrispum wychmicini TaxID=1213861 RepID=A0A4R2JTV7_9PSEU|nr:crotonobetaine/carnitine-CoA ligase [Actinocrispum wychmicini]